MKALVRILRIIIGLVFIVFILLGAGIGAYCETGWRKLCCLPIILLAMIVATYYLKIMGKNRSHDNQTDGAG